MATSTILREVISNQSFLPALISGVVAAIVALSGQYYFSWRSREEERYKVLYGPLIYNLLMMKILTDNRQELTDEILKMWQDIDTKNSELVKNINPLIKQWIDHKDNLEKLLKDNTGYLRKADLKLIKDFLDGCVKRKIISAENGGTNVYAINEGRLNKLLNSISALQDKLLKFI